MIPDFYIAVLEQGREETPEMDKGCWGLGSRQLSPLSNKCP